MTIYDFLHNQLSRNYLVIADFHPKACKKNAALLTIENTF